MPHIIPNARTTPANLRDGSSASTAQCRAYGTLELVRRVGKRLNRALHYLFAGFVLGSSSVMSTIVAVVRSV
jgi:hypothetical protein